MKNIYAIVLAVFLMVALAGVVSADRTFVSGVVYDKDIVTGPRVSGADVTVTCGENVLNTTSIADGNYAVLFDYAQCGVDSLVQIHAEKDGRTGNANATVGSGPVAISLDYAVGNVVLIPEFGLLMGALTIVGALVAFFVIRRK